MEPKSKVAAVPAGKETKSAVCVDGGEVRRCAKRESRAGVKEGEGKEEGRVKRVEGGEYGGGQELISWQGEGFGVCPLTPSLTDQ